VNNCLKNWLQAALLATMRVSLNRHESVMELAEAIRQLTPLQLQIPNPRRPLQWQAHCAAEVFLVKTTRGPAVVWVEAFWCRADTDRVAHIAYASPRRQGAEDRWIDQDPRYGPHCLAYQRPVVIERVTKTSPVWRDHKAWQVWRAGQGSACGRRAAWQRVQNELGPLIQERLT